MSRYYFHVRRNNVIFEDHEGVEASTVAEAVEHATEDARAVMREEPEVPRDIQWIEIADDMGNTVRTVPFETISQSGHTVR